MKCPKCGYEYHPCDLICDRCGAEPPKGGRAREGGKMKINNGIWEVWLSNAGTPKETASLDLSGALPLGREELLEFIQALSLLHARMTDPEKGYKIKLESDE